MKNTTLLFLLKDDHILLAMKKRGFGANRWNGIGGKIDPGETVEEAAIRECQEEIGVTPRNLEKVAHHTFWLPSLTDFQNKMVSHTFITREWDGEPIETEEMAPQWYHVNDIPYHAMWGDDQYWLPQMLAGNKLVCEFTFDDQDNMISKRVTTVDANHELLV